MKFPSSYTEGQASKIPPCPTSMGKLVETSGKKIFNLDLNE
jgi:hypothetical protein